jgi:formylglycine-generating enzyme required for sulfatase activity
MRFVWIQPGSFLMGSPLNEPDRRPNETQHQVTLTKGFYLGIYPVTVREWGMVMVHDRRIANGPDYPAGGVSWSDGQEFCKARGRKKITCLLVAWV